MFARFSAPCRVRAAFLGTAAVVAMSCASPTESLPPEPPTPTLVVTVTSRVTRPAEFVPFNGGYAMRCGVEFVASGTGTGLARWQGATLRWYAGADRRSPLDSLVIPPDESAGWIRDSVSATLSNVAEWTVSFPIPFELEASFTYRVLGRDSSSVSTTRFGCGVLPDPAGSPAKVELIEPVGNKSVYEPGDTLQIRYRASSVDGLVQTAIGVSGAFVADTGFNEWNAPSRERTVRFVIPRSANLAAGVIVRVQALDVGLRVTDTSTTMAYRFADQSPPTVTMWRNGPGQLTPDDTLVLQGAAWDNIGVIRAHWTLGTPAIAQGVMPLTSGGDGNAPFILRLPVQPEWVGRDADFRIRSEDAMGFMSPEFTVSDTLLRVHAIATAPVPVEARVAPSLTGTHRLGAIVWDQLRRQLYVSMGATTRIAAVDYPTLADAGMVQITPGTGMMDLSVSGDSLIITHPGRTWLSVVQISGLRRLDSLPVRSLDTLTSSFVPPQLFPHGLSVTASGRVLLMLVRAAMPTGYGTIEVDLATGTSRIRRDAHPYDESNDAGFWMGASPSRDRIAIVGPGCRRWFYSASGTFSTCKPGRSGDGMQSRGVSFSASGHRVFVGGRVYDESFDVVARLPDWNGVLSADGQFVWVLDRGRLVKIRVSDQRRVLALRLPGPVDRLMRIGNTDELLLIQDTAMRIGKLSVAGY